ncbi:MAG: hypothetical protein JST59_02755 [Actinobacteria bacterium]|nr:hypothetical protein [Actinomycetota bacterium]
MVGFYQEEAAIAESNEDWLTAVATFLEDGDKERVVLATRGGRLLASIANTFEFEVRHASKRNICSMCVVGQSIIVGEENGRLLRLSSFEDGFTKELNLSQQKLPIEILQKHNDTQVLVGTC